MSDCPFSDVCVWLQRTWGSCHSVAITSKVLLDWWVCSVSISLCCILVCAQFYVPCPLKRMPFLWDPVTQIQYEKFSHSQTQLCMEISYISQKANPLCWLFSAYVLKVDIHQEYINPFYALLYSPITCMLTTLHLTVCWLLLHTCTGGCWRHTRTTMDVVQRRWQAARCCYIEEAQGKDLPIEHVPDT